MKSLGVRLALLYAFVSTATLAGLFVAGYYLLDQHLVRDACQLQPNALSIKLSDQIEQLDELISDEGDGAIFFEKTFITQGMQDLITEGIARLAGASTQAIFDTGHEVGELAKQHFPGGIEVGKGIVAIETVLKLSEKVR